MKKFSAIPLITAGLLSVSVMSLAAEPPTASGKADILVQSQSSWNGKPYQHYPTQRPELTVIKLTIPANSALPWHEHSFPNAGYVLQGQLTLEDKASGKSHTFKQGEAFTESVGSIHRGVSGDQPTVLILTYSGVKGKPTFIPAPGEKGEY
ncbi:cupin domain-containing protein [Tatumella citrea]|uniref:Cupin n=1 Tax=Tatumella citrea TaxID=53336 RepID=A0A1Y0L665_TATCI|nr:cupin domain-containing protein [Tatumella citrea]ARU93148.1 cupin [Tatumella citrea]ARU97187.1 cupin [Tatumella citrea]